MLWSFKRITNHHIIFSNLSSLFTLCIDLSTNAMNIPAQIQKRNTFNTNSFETERIYTLYFHTCSDEGSISNSLISLAAKCNPNIKQSSSKNSIHCRHLQYCCFPCCSFRLNQNQKRNLSVSFCFFVCQL